MPHQCVKCSKIIPEGSKEILTGCCDCKGRFFSYIRKEQIENMNKNPLIEMPDGEKNRIEKDIREIAGISDDQAPVILDLESVKAVGEGKYEIDVVNLFNKKRPLIYKMEEGKYIIDLIATLGKSSKEMGNS